MSEIALRICLLNYHRYGMPHTGVISFTDVTGPPRLWLREKYCSPCTETRAIIVIAQINSVDHNHHIRTKK